MQPDYLVTARQTAPPSANTVSTKIKDYCAPKCPLGGLVLQVTLKNKLAIKNPKYLYHVCVFQAFFLILRAVFSFQSIFLLLFYSIYCVSDTVQSLQVKVTESVVIPGHLNGKKFLLRLLIKCTGHCWSYILSIVPYFSHLTLPFNVCFEFTHIKIKHIKQERVSTGLFGSVKAFLSLYDGQQAGQPKANCV